MKVIFLMFLTAWGLPSVRADFVDLGADKDTTLFQSNVNNSAGSGPGFFVGTNGNISPRRGLISFNLSGIPSGSIITGVQLTLTLGQVAGGGGGGGNDDPRVIGLHELTRNWGEGTTGAAATTIDQSGMGFAAAAGDATWNAASFSSGTPGSWINPGGDFVAAPSASMTLVGTTIGTPYTWTSTPDLIADVQGWLDHPATNFGWEIVNADEMSARTFFAFYSSEWSGRANGDPLLEARYANQEPLLRIFFTVPEPASGALGAMGMLTFFAACRYRRGRYRAPKMQLLV